MLGVSYYLYVGRRTHEHLLWQFSQKYAKVKHPASTRHVRDYKELGLLIGNGDHCDLFVGELRSYTCSRQQLLKQYASQKFWSPISEEYLPVEILFIDKGKVESGILYHGEIESQLPAPIERIAADAKAAKERSKRYYIVYIFDPGYDAGFDVRCL